MPCTYDALAEREQLARDLADWTAAGFWSSQRAWRWHRRVRRLARVCGLPHEEVLADLRQDAEQMRGEPATN